MDHIPELYLTQVTIQAHRHCVPTYCSIRKQF